MTVFVCSSCERPAHLPHKKGCGYLIPPAPDPIREAGEALAERVEWVLRDASYKAPEQIDAEMAKRWMEVLQAALAAWKEVAK